MAAGAEAKTFCFSGRAGRPCEEVVGGAWGCRGGMARVGILLAVLCESAAVGSASSHDNEQAIGGGGRWEDESLLADANGSAAQPSPSESSMTNIDRLLRGLHHVTLTKKLNDLGFRHYSGHSTERLEHLLATSTDQHEHVQVRTKMDDFMKPGAPHWDQWELSQGDGSLPPYYRNRVTGAVKWAPGKWRRRRSNRNNDDAHDRSQRGSDVTFSGGRTPSNEAATNQMLQLLTDLHTHEKQERTVSRETRPTDAPRLYEMLTLLFAAVAVAALVVCRAFGALKTQEPMHLGTPDALLCPISLEPMIDPVTVVETGQTYEHAAIKGWFYTHCTDPISNIELRSKKLVPNIAIRKMTRTFDKHTATEVHDSLVCPISLELMFDPVILVETGQTYDRLTIESWLLKHSTDPITNTELRSKKMVPNIAIRKLVQSRQAEYPEQEMRTTTLPGPPHLPASRSAWLASIGGGMRKRMLRSESAGRVLDLIGSWSTTSAVAGNTTGNMLRRKTQSFTNLGTLEGLETSQGAPVH
eukprot:COSAG02_NODE_3509_length_6634_cov_2.750574_4_plen_527_part_00